MPVISGVILSGYVGPCAPENPITQSFIRSRIISPVEVCSHTGIKPPAGAIVGSTIPGGVAVVILIRGGEGLIVVVVHSAEEQSITCGACVTAHRQSVLQLLTSNAEVRVLRMLPHTIEVLQLHPKHHVPVMGQQMDHIVAQPELSTQLSKAGPVLRPGAVEAHAPVHSTLQNSPSSTFLLHVTENIEACVAVVGGHTVNSTVFVP